MARVNYVHKEVTEAWTNSYDPGRGEIAVRGDAVGPV